MKIKGTSEYLYPTGRVIKRMVLYDFPFNNKYNVLTDIGGQVGNALKIPGNSEQVEALFNGGGTALKKL